VGRRSKYPEEFRQRAAQLVLDSDYYSVHPAVIGRRIEVVADLARVRVLRPAADHERAGPSIRRSPPRST
jgi:transposase-like protein